MPGSKRTFTYVLVPQPGQEERVLAKATKIMGWACEGDPRITCHEVSGAALGVVTLSMTIHGRDRWWTTQLAQDILDGVLLGVGTIARLQLDSERQTPHDHRGYAYGRTKRYRDRRQPRQPQAAGAPDEENEFSAGAASDGSSGSSTTVTGTSTASST